MRKLAIVFALFLSVVATPAASASTGATHVRFAQAHVIVDVPVDSGTLQVQLDVSRETVTRNGEPLADVVRTGFFGIHLDATGSEVAFAYCLFEPAQAQLDPLRAARLVASGSCENWRGEDPVFFSVDLTWERGQLEYRDSWSTQLGASVSGTVTVQGVTVQLQDAAGTLYSQVQLDRVAGVFSGGGGGGNAADMSACLNGGYVLGNSYDTTARYAAAANGTYHVSGRFVVTLTAGSIDGTVETLSGTATYAESFPLPPLDEFGQRIHFIDVPVSLEGSNGSRVDAVLDIALFTYGSDIYPLLFGVECA